MSVLRLKNLLFQTSLYLRGSGGFGGPASSEKVIEPAKIPADRAPDAVSEYQVNFINYSKRFL